MSIPTILAIPQKTIRSESAIEWRIETRVDLWNLHAQSCNMVHGNKYGNGQVADRLTAILRTSLSKATKAPADSPENTLLSTRPVTVDRYIVSSDQNVPGKPLLNPQARAGVMLLNEGESFCTGVSTSHATPVIQRLLERSGLEGVHQHRLHEFCKEFSNLAHDAFTIRAGLNPDPAAPQLAIHRILGHGRENAILGQGRMTDVRTTDWLADSQRLRQMQSWLTPIHLHNLMEAGLAPHALDHFAGLMVALDVPALNSSEEGYALLQRYLGIFRHYLESPTYPDITLTLDSHERLAFQVPYPDQGDPESTCIHLSPMPDVKAAAADKDLLPTLQAVLHRYDVPVFQPLGRIL